MNYMLYDMDVEVVEMKLTGVWQIGNNDHIGLKYYDGQKPKWFHRLMARVFLGWTWVDLK